MIHKIQSSASVLYDAMTMQSSQLTIVPSEVLFRNRVNNTNDNQEKNNISVMGVLFANHGSENPVRLNSINFNLDEDDWDAFYASQSLTHTDDYDNLMKCCLLYIQQNLMPMYGLSSNDWTYSYS
jgi:hypothetical protein